MTIFTKVCYVLSISFSVLSAVFVFLSLNWELWETVVFDREALRAIASSDPTVLIEFPAGDDSYFIVAPNANYTSKVDANDSSLTQTYYIATVEYGGLWRTCDTISDAVRAYAKSQQYVIQDQCHNYHDQYNEAEFATYPYLEILTGLTRSADACALVSMITVFASSLLGVFAVSRHQIFFAMITGVTYFASGTYTIFTIILMVLRKVQLSHDVKDLPSVVVSARAVQSSLCVYLATTAVCLSMSAGAAWVMLSVHLKRRCGVNYMYSSNYDQICSM